MIQDVLDYLDSDLTKINTNTATRLAPVKRVSEYQQ